MAKGININDFKVFTEFLAKKSGKGDAVSPSQFNLLVNNALSEFCAKENGGRNQYQPGRPVPNISFEKTADIMDDLRYIKETREFTVNTDSEFGIPDGSTVTDRNGDICPEYIHWKSIRHYYYLKVGDAYIKKQYDVTPVTEAELGKRLVSSINIPNMRYPICQINSSTIKTYPRLQYVVMDYLRYPVDAVWAYTTTNDRPVYDPANSVDIELPKECRLKLTMIYLSYLGINMRDNELLQYAEMNKQTQP